MILSTGKEPVELLDLPDEIVLIIMQKLEPPIERFVAFVGLGYERLERLAIERCSSIDLTVYVDRSSQRMLVPRFFSHVMPCVHERIHSMTINIRQLRYVIGFGKSTHDQILPNLTSLKLLRDMRLSENGTPVTTRCFNDTELRRAPLFSTLPQLFFVTESVNELALQFLRSSPVMDSLTSLELDDNWMFRIPPSDQLLFPRSSLLAHLRVTVTFFTDCVHLLRQLGSQLCSLNVSVIYIHRRDLEAVSLLTTLSCPTLRKFSLFIYRNVIHFKQSILPLLRQLSSIVHLQLFSAIGRGRRSTNHFIDGLDLQRDITSHMPHLQQFDFHIRSIVRRAPQIHLNSIRQSFVDFQQPVQCSLDYFNNAHGQCHVFSLPFFGTRLDLISNRFPLFDVPKTFTHVTSLFLFDDVKPFEHTFFARLPQTLPHLRTLELHNELAQQQPKSDTTQHVVKLPRLMTLIMHDIHLNYAEQMLCRSHLPSLVELVIRRAPLLAVIEQDQELARDNCSHIRVLHTPAPWTEATDAVRTFLPLVSDLHHEK